MIGYCESSSTGHRLDVAPSVRTGKLVSSNEVEGYAGSTLVTGRFNLAGLILAEEPDKLRPTPNTPILNLITYLNP
jgi:hypothetical protein